MPSILSFFAALLISLFSFSVVADEKECVNSELLMDEFHHAHPDYARFQMWGGDDEDVERFRAWLDRNRPGEVATGGIGVVLVKHTRVNHQVLVILYHYVYEENLSCTTLVWEIDLDTVRAIFRGEDPPFTGHAVEW